MRIAAIIWLLVVAAGDGFAAGGSSEATARPAAPTAQQRAEKQYEAGLRHRDRAWEHEKKAAAADKEKERLKRLEKAQKDFIKAVKAQRQAIELYPKYHQAHSSLGYALRRLGRYQEALASYDRALELEPDYVEAIEYRAEAYLALGRYTQTQQAYATLLRKNPDYAAQLLVAMRQWAGTPAAPDSVLVDSAATMMREWIAEQTDKVSDPAADKTW
jgi:tetratricopeptide (TPR) repeat protein